MANLISQNSAGGHVVAVTESAGDAEDLIVGQQYRPVEQTIDVEPIGATAGTLEREDGFAVAVRARCTQDQDSRLCHDWSPFEARMLIQGQGESSGACQAAFKRAMSARTMVWPDNEIVTSVESVTSPRRESGTRSNEPRT